MSSDMNDDEEDETKTDEDVFNFVNKPDSLEDPFDNDEENVQTKLEENTKGKEKETTVALPLLTK